MTTWAKNDSSLAQYCLHFNKKHQDADWLDFQGMENRWDLTGNSHPLLVKEEVFYISYMDRGGKISIKNIPENLPHYWFDPV
ncbi:MAG: hypothetical protein H3C48_02225 [Chitinophagaceae bacterium]|nr:hypothetical protein [Chitinophagaceae bacterium]